MKFGPIKIQWFVSATTPGLGGEPCVLHVSRSGFPFGVRPQVPASFKNVEAAWKWAYEHGYLQDYFSKRSDVVITLTRSQILKDSEVYRG